MLNNFLGHSAAPSTALRRRLLDSSEVMMLTLLCSETETSMKSADLDYSLTAPSSSEDCPSMPSLGASPCNSGPVIISTISTLLQSKWKKKMTILKWWLKTALLNSLTKFEYSDLHNKTRRALRKTLPFVQAMEDIRFIAIQERNYMILKSICDATDPRYFELFRSRYNQEDFL